MPRQKHNLFYVVDQEAERLYEDLSRNNLRVRPVDTFHDSAIHNESWAEELISSKQIKAARLNKL